LNRKYLHIFTVLILFQSVNSYSQRLPFNSEYENHFKLNSKLYSPAEINESASSTLPVFIGLWTFVYLFNPIIQLENDKISGGLTKEFSVGFGDFGQYRISAEYSYLFRQNQNSFLRGGLKYDILLKSGIQPSNTLQSTSAVTIGGGYFTNFTNYGFFPEVSYGYSIRNDKLLIYPSIKVRYTFVTGGADITDFSFGLVLGIANPFIDLKIRTYKK
jgi:hypothetical protein